MEMDLLFLQTEVLFRRISQLMGAFLFLVFNNQLLVSAVSTTWMEMDLLFLQTEVLFRRISQLMGAFLFLVFNNLRRKLAEMELLKEQKLVTGIKIVWTLDTFLEQCFVKIVAHH